MTKVRVTFPSGGGGTPYALDIEDEGINVLSNPDAINFTGAGVTVTESPSGTALVDIPGGGTPYALDIEKNGSPILSNPDTINFTGTGVTVIESPSGTAIVDIPSSAVQNWTESESAGTQQNTRWTPNSISANVSAVIQPKGNGANLAQRPDGTTAGGNARGQFATDFQKGRTSQNQVASGNYSTISGGQNNRASGLNSWIPGGLQNTATGAYSSATGREATAAFYLQRAHGAGLNSAEYQFSMFSFNAQPRGAGAGDVSVFIEGAAGAELFLNTTNEVWSCVINYSLIALTSGGGVTQGDVFTQIDHATYRRAFGSTSLLGINTISTLNSASLAGVTVTNTIVSGNIRIFFSIPSFGVNIDFRPHVTLTVNRIGQA